MADLKAVYRCEVCGNIVEVYHAGAGELVCCGQPMKKLDEQTADSATEKHVPVVEKKDGGYLVTVGSVEHPMTDQHYIEWIEIAVDNDKVYRQHLNPGEKPQAFFAIQGNKVVAREYCTIHGLWKQEV